jgi:RNA polymerase sigma-70 factor (sigma-E family)
MGDGTGADFDAYVRASGPRLSRLAFLLTGDHDTAEDLLQTAYAKVLPRWRQVSTYEDPDAYLRRVMVNTRTSWWRRHRGRESSWAQVPDTAARGDVADDEAVLDEVLAALRRLPRRQQVAVVLRHYCDLSEAETAAVMGISVGGVKSTTSKGLAALRAVLRTDPTTTETSEEAAR